MQWAEIRGLFEVVDIPDHREAPEVESLVNSLITLRELIHELEIIEKKYALSSKYELTPLFLMRLTQIGEVLRVSGMDVNYMISLIANSLAWMEKDSKYSYTQTFLLLIFSMREEITVALGETLDTNTNKFKQPRLL